jgi:hypothetical protein
MHNTPLIPFAELCISACKIHYAIENTGFSLCVWSYNRGSAMLDESQLCLT